MTSTDKRYALAWDALTVEERHQVAASTYGEAPEGTVLKLAKTVGVLGAFWPGFQSGPDRWDVGEAFVEYVRDRLARD